MDHFTSAFSLNSASVIKAGRYLTVDADTMMMSCWSIEQRTRWNTFVQETFSATIIRNRRWIYHLHHHVRTFESSLRKFDITFRHTLRDLIYFAGFRPKHHFSIANIRHLDVSTHWVDMIGSADRIGISLPGCAGFPRLSVPHVRECALNCGRDCQISTCYSIGS